MLAHGRPDHAVPHHVLHMGEAGSRKKEAGSRKQEAGSRQQDAGSTPAYPGTITTGACALLPLPFRVQGTVIVFTSSVDPVKGCETSTSRTSTPATAIEAGTSVRHFNQVQERSDSGQRVENARSHEVGTRVHTFHVVQQAKLGQRCVRRVRRSLRTRSIGKRDRAADARIPIPARPRVTCNSKQAAYCNTALGTQERLAAAECAALDFAKELREYTVRLTTNSTPPV